MFIMFPQNTLANYSEQYSEELSHLVITKPQKALEISQENYTKAQKINDVEGQLIALYYIVSALDVLSIQDDVDETISKGLSLANAHNNQRFKSEFTGMMSYRLEIKGQYLEAIKLASKALGFARETNDDRIIAEQLANRGQIQMSIENYDLALQDVENAITYFKQNDDKENLSLNYNLLAIIYSSISDYDNAIKYYKESEDYDLVKSSYNQAALYYNLGTVYIDKKEYDKAKQYFEKSSEQSKITNDINTLAYSQYGIADIYLLQGDFEQAEKELKPIFEIFERNHDILMSFNSHLLMSDIKINRKLYKQALDYLAVAKLQSESMNTPTVKMNYMTQKMLYHVAKQEWKQAYEMNKKSKELLSKTQQQEKEKLISELQVRYNAQFDQEKMKLLQQQNKLQQSAIIQEKTTKQYLLGLIILGLIVLLITFLGYTNQRNSKKHLHRLSITDDLTQVANRRYIMEQFKALHQESIKNNKPFTLVMIDLDYFKSINDRYGHDVGNEVLIYFAKTATRIMNGSGEIGRIGGEEWIILIQSNEPEFIKSKLASLRKSFGDALSLSIPKDYKLSFSCGVLICNGQYQSYEKMLTDVDKAMYQAKESGREQDVYI